MDESQNFLVAVYCKPFMMDELQGVVEASGIKPVSAWISKAFHPAEYERKDPLTGRDGYDPGFQVHFLLIKRDKDKMIELLDGKKSKDYYNTEVVVRIGSSKLERVVDF